MKKCRSSNVQAYHGLILEEVSRKREELVRKFVTSEVSRKREQFAQKHQVKSASTTIEKAKNAQNSNEQKVKKDDIEFIPLNVQKINHECFIDRADENVRQWGNRMKIPVDKVRMLAAQLKTNMKPRIRYQRPQ